MKKTVFAALFCLVPAGLPAQQPLLDIKVPAEPDIKVATPAVTAIQPAAAPVAAEIIPVIEPGPAKPVSKLKQAPSAPAPAKPAAKPVVQAAPKPAVTPAAPASTVAAARPSGLQAGKTHKVSGGDTLWDLSSKYYQDPYKWGKIYNANLQTVENPDRIYPLEELVIPDITEEVRPARKPAAISGSDTFREPGVSVTEAPRPAVTAAAVPRPAVARAEDLFKDSDDQLSEEMPEHHKEWASGVKIVPEGWREDGVITARLKNDDDFLSETMAVSGEMLQIAMSGPAAVKPGDYLAIYLKGAMAYDKAGQQLGLEVQPAGLAEVVSVDGSVVKARVVEAVTAITKGFIVKKK
ncbi:MAG: LysM peptidoglycan-binding domain-containing protein [Elusimicrobiales bacterium]